MLDLVRFSHKHVQHEPRFGMPLLVVLLDLARHSQRQIQVGLRLDMSFLVAQLDLIRHSLIRVDEVNAHRHGALIPSIKIRHAVSST